MNIRQKRAFFLRVFRKVERKYAQNTKRLAGEGWVYDWQTLIVTIMSAQSRDETTIPIAENLFKRYSSLESLAQADYNDVLGIFMSLNYNRTKARNVIAASQLILKEFDGRIPDRIEELVCIPGVGRKTANLVLSEVHKKQRITVDTHVHRISNVLGLVRTKTPIETEYALEKIVPQRYWSRINRLFVLWGKDVPGRDKRELLRILEK